MSNETLSWDDAETFFGESLPVDGGYVTRMHSSKECTNRIAPEQPMAVRATFSAPAVNLCTACTSTAIASSFSSSVVLMRDIRGSLKRIVEDSEIRSRAVEARVQIEATTSVHPGFEEARSLALEEAETLAETLPVFH